MEQKKTYSVKRAIVLLGLTAFATQFGAGNLIFPPFLGRETGEHWLIGYFGFFLIDVGLACLVIYSGVVNRRGTQDGVVAKIGYIPGKILLTTIIVCLGLIIANPRTAATSFEMGIHELVPSLPLWLFSLVYFAVVIFLAIRPSKVVDIVGNYLTPVLLIVMLVLIVKGIITPQGDPTPVAGVTTGSAFSEGIVQGYQTLDGIGGLLIFLLLVNNTKDFGYTDSKSIRKIVGGADVLACVLLGLVYGGLAYVGGTVSGVESYADYDQAGLLINLSRELLGNAGGYALTIIVLFACLTTSIGLSSIVGNFFLDLSHGKIKYSWSVIFMNVWAFGMSQLGLTTIIAIAGPILTIVYAPMIVLGVMAYTDKFIHNDHVAFVAAYVALVVSIIQVTNVGGLGDKLAFLPFTSAGLGWIIPAVIGGIIGAFWKDKKLLAEYEAGVFDNDTQF